MNKSKIAIIGSGISGLSSAWYLSKKYSVDIYEKNNYFGGHSDTHTFVKNNKKINVDTGFIVFNDLNYPNLCNFFEDLGVRSYASDMSFSVSMNSGALQYSGSSFASMFAQKKNIFNYKFLKMLFEIVKFYRNAEKDKEIYTQLTIDQYLKKKKYSYYFKLNHLYPMAASIWSTPIEKISKYPLKEFVNFFSNHGLLRILNRPKWKTVEGGSKEYVKRVLNNPKIRSFKNKKVKLGKNIEGKWEVIFDNSKKKYDHLILAIHSDQVKNIFTNYRKDYFKFFSQIKYSKNIVYLHSDERLMPQNKNVWASWNYLESDSTLSVTYWMNLLQNLNTSQNFFVSLNPEINIDKKKIRKKVLYHHPTYTFETFDAQKKIQLIQGQDNLWFCGAYLGYGFHEDGISSGLKVAKDLQRRL